MSPPPSSDPTTESELSSHVLITTDTSTSKPCYFCKLCCTQDGDSSGASKYTCYECRVAFHPECFFYYHRSEYYRETRPDIFSLAQEALKREKRKGTRRRLHKDPAQLTDASVPIVKRRKTRKDVPPPNIGTKNIGTPRNTRMDINTLSHGKREIAALGNVRQDTLPLSSIRDIETTNSDDRDDIMTNDDKISIKTTRTRKND